MTQSDYSSRETELKTPVRNRYFYGKLLDVFQFELETDYFNSKRRLLNRLVTGSGVVCGLGVDLTDDNKGVIVQPGLAIDRCGREIIVTKRVQSEPLPPFPPYPSSGAAKQEYQSPHYEGREYRPYCKEDYAHVVLCYHECPGDPVPALIGDCESALCAPGSIREQYKIEIRHGYAPERKSDFPDVIKNRRIDSRALIDYVTHACRAIPDDCCIPLADIGLRHSGDGWKPEVDIYARPIVYTNRLLFNLIVSLLKEQETE